MIVDLLSPANYIMVNRDAIKTLGLTTAVYISELLTIYKKVVNKKKFVNEDNFFEVDRSYIEKQTSLVVEEQLKCDLNLAKVNIIKIDENNPNIIYFDTETFASVLASEDIKILKDVSNKVKVETPKAMQRSKTAYAADVARNAITCKSKDILLKLYDWTDSIFGSGKWLSKNQVKLFQETLENYCSDGDIDKTIAIINIAIANSYTDCHWAINAYEKQLKLEGNVVNTPNAKINTNNSRFQSFTRASEQKTTTEVSKEVF